MYTRLVTITFHAITRDFMHIIMSMGCLINLLWKEATKIRIM